MQRANCFVIAALIAVAELCAPVRTALAQPAGPEETKAIEAELTQLRAAIDGVKQNPNAEIYLPDIAVYAKAADWILRHNEFYKPDYVKQTRNALKTGMERTARILLAKGAPDWNTAHGK